MTLGAGLFLGHGWQEFYPERTLIVNLPNVLLEKGLEVQYMVNVDMIQLFTSTRICTLTFICSVKAVFLIHCIF